MSSTLESLAQDLPPDEKRALLAQIQSSLNLSARDTDSIVSRAQAPDELKVRLQKEVRSLGLWERWWLRLASLLSNRSEYEIMGDRRLAPTRQTLKDKIPELTDFTRQEWTPDFARALYDIYAEAMALKPVFDHLFLGKITLEAGILRMIRDEYPAAPQSLEDVFPEADIARLYLSDPRKSVLQAELVRRLNAVLAQVPPAPLDRVKRRLQSLYLLKPLVQYPYGFLFELFGHSPDKAEILKYPYFLGAPWRKAAALFERLYYGLTLAARTDLRTGDLEGLFSSAAERLGTEKEAWSLELIQTRIGALIRTALDLTGRVPWVEVLKWSFQDPYYGVKYVLPQFNLKDFYRGSLEMHLRDELDEQIPLVRQALVDQDRTLLFPPGLTPALEHYLPGQGEVLSARYQVNGFRYAGSLGLLWGLLAGHIQKKLVPFHQSLVRMLPPGSKSMLQSLNAVVDDLTLLRQKIAQFDRSLHPDSEDGKAFQRLFHEVASRTLSLKPFLQLLDQKDDEARDLFLRSLEALQSLLQHLSGVRDRQVPALKSILALPYLLEGREETIENGLDRHLIILRKGLFVLRETHDLEA